MAHYTVVIIRNPQNSIGNYLGPYSSLGVWGSRVSPMYCSGWVGFKVRKVCIGFGGLGIKAINKSNWMVRMGWSVGVEFRPRLGCGVQGLGVRVYVSLRVSNFETPTLRPNPQLSDETLICSTCTSKALNPQLKRYTLRHKTIKP